MQASSSLFFLPFMRSGFTNFDPQSFVLFFIFDSFSLRLLRCGPKLYFIYISIFEFRKEKNY
jgi:hypothetical protein